MKERKNAILYQHIMQLFQRNYKLFVHFIVLMIYLRLKYGLSCFFLSKVFNKFLFLTFSELQLTLSVLLYNPDLRISFLFSKYRNYFLADMIIIFI